MASSQVQLLSGEEATAQRKDLERRWNALEDAADGETDCESAERAKEQWFLDALLFLAKAPLNQHSWCQLSDLSSLVLESFYHFYGSPNEALSLVWRRWCRELRSCDSCVYTYQRSKEELREEFDGGPATEELFAVLERLDQERVAQQLQEMKALFEAGNYDPEQSADLIFPTIYEVLNYPAILEDAEVDHLVAPVLSFMDQVHAISIGEYRPAGVYSLLFHNSPEGRSVATRLAKTTQPFRDGQDMEIVQPILRRKVALLQQLAGSGVTHVGSGEPLQEEKLAIFGGRAARPVRVQEHLPLWLGLSTFLELLEPAAMLGGLVERHPDVVSVVLNQASEPGNPAFNVALKCLKLLFQGVGYRLWWDTDFTPKVVRSTLVSHCNTSHKENLHLTIFQLFEPFLQSLEVDRSTSDEFYDERETLLKFLTKQVANSQSFSGVVKSKALEVAFRIIQRGYTLVPPMPPTDLAPFWGPPLVATLNDSSAQGNLRTQAIELASTFVVFDSSALSAVVFPTTSGFSGGSEIVACLPGASGALGAPSDVEQEPLAGQPADSGWGAEWAALETAAGGYAKEHYHPPALWQALFLATTRVNFPGLLTKAVLWAATRLAMLEEAVGLDPDLTTGERSKDWPYTVLEEGKKVSNVVEAKKEGLKDLVMLYRRCTAAYLDHLRQQSVNGDVAVLQAVEWETWIAESVLILLLDPTALIRNADREILKYFTADHTLDGGLRTLCADPPAARAVSEGIYKASEKLLRMGFPKCARGSQLLCFYATKLLRVNSSHEPDTAGGGSEQGTLWAIVCARIAEGLWPLLLRVLEGSRPAAESFERLVVHVLEAFVAAWPFVRHRALPLTAPGRFPWAQNPADVSSSVRAPAPSDAAASPAVGFAAPVRTPSVFDLVEGGRLKAPGTQGDEWLGEFVRWGHVTRPAVRRRWMECVELIGCEMADAGARLLAGARATVQELLAPTSSLTDEQRLVLSQFFPYEAPGNLGQSALDALPTRPTPATQPKPPVPSRQSSFETPPRVKAPSQSRLSASFLEGGSPQAAAGFFQPPPTAVLAKPPTVVIDLEDEDQPLTLRKKERGTAHVGSSRKPIDLETEGEAKPQIDAFQRTAAQTHFGEASSSGRDTADQASKMAASLAAFANRASGSKPSLWGRSPAGGSKTGAPDTKRTPPPPNRTSPMFSRRAAPRYPQQVKIDSMLSRQGEDEQLERAWAAADGLGGFAPASPPKRKPDTGDASRKRETDSKPLSAKPQPAPTVPGGSERPANRGVVEETGTVHSRGIPGVAPKVPRAAPVAPRKTMRIELPGEGQTASARARMRRFGNHGPPPPPPKPDDWYKKILAMDFYKVVGSDDPDDGVGRPTNEGVETLVQVPYRFDSPAEYARVFRPLLMEEFKAQLQRVHYESGSSSNSEMLEIGHFKLLSLARRDDFWDASFVADDAAERNVRECSELDLLLLTRQAPSQGDPSRAHVLAKVDRRDQRDNKGQQRRRCTVLVLKLFLPINEPRLLKAKQLLTDGSKWFATKLFSMVPQMREFQAMSAFHTLPLVSTLLNPSSAKPRPKSAKSSPLSKLPEPLRKQLLSRFNDSQLGAISSSFDSGGPHNQRLTLIQGPPGTGKTSTIMGILSALLSGPGGNVTRAERVPGGGLGATRPVKAPVKLSEREEAALLTAQAQRAWQQAEKAKGIMDQGGEDESELPGGVQTGEEGTPRILLCAQSNAAVDELVARLLKSGVWGADGLPFRPSIVRVGNIRTMHPDSRPVHIDSLVDAETRSPSPSDGVNRPGDGVNKPGVNKSASEDRKRQLRNSLVKISSEMSAAQKKNGPSGGGADGPAGEGEEKLKKTLDKLYQQRKAVQSEIIALEAADRKTREQERAERAAKRRRILREASIVVTTLSGCGGDVYSACKESKGAEAGGLFDAVIIDEAAQALEPATLIPLQLLVARRGQCIMIGDPKQLPATVLSRAAASFNYERSLFERLQRGGFPVTMLSAQYRMHPEIRQFPSAHFYGGLLTDGEGVSQATRAVPFHERPVFGPYVFFDVIDGHERSRGGASSLSNDEEATAVLDLYQGVRKSYPGEDLRGRVGVITPYKQQLEALRRKFREALGERAVADVEFNTVDGFQGREVDVLILSTVRTGGIGFVADVRRMNVALTRARNSLWIVGNSAALKRNPHWAALISNATGRGLVFKASRPYSALFKPGKSDLKALPRPSSKDGERKAGAKLGSDDESKKAGVNVGAGAGEEVGVNAGSGGAKGEKRPPGELIPLGRNKKPKLTEASPLGVKRKADMGSLEVPAAKAGRPEAAESSKLPGVKYTPLVDDSRKPEEKIAGPGDFLRPAEVPVDAAQPTGLKSAPTSAPKAPRKSILKNAISRLEAAGGTLPPLNLAPQPPGFAAGGSPAHSTPGSRTDSVFSRPIEAPKSSPFRPAPLEIPPVQPPRSMQFHATGSVTALNGGFSTPVAALPQQRPAPGGPEAPELPPGFETFAKGEAVKTDGGLGAHKIEEGSSSVERSLKEVSSTGVGEIQQKKDNPLAKEPSPQEASAERRIRELKEKLRQESDKKRDPVTPRGSSAADGAEREEKERKDRNDRDERTGIGAEKLSTEEEKERRNRENAKRYAMERVHEKRDRKGDEKYHRVDSRDFKEPKERPSREKADRDRSRERSRERPGKEADWRERSRERSYGSERGSEPSPRESPRGNADERRDRRREADRGGGVSRSESRKDDRRKEERRNRGREEDRRDRDRGLDKREDKSREGWSDRRSKSVEESPRGRGKYDRNREKAEERSPKRRDEGGRGAKDSGEKNRASVEQSPRGSGKEERERRRNEESDSRKGSGSGGASKERSNADKLSKFQKSLEAAEDCTNDRNNKNLKGSASSKVAEKAEASLGDEMNGKPSVIVANRGASREKFRSASVERAGERLGEKEKRTEKRTEGLPGGLKAENKETTKAERGVLEEPRQQERLKTAGGSGRPKVEDLLDGPNKSGDSRRDSGKTSRVEGRKSVERSSGEGRADRGKIQCRFFPNCDKGNTCRFAHIESIKSPCRYFRVGDCWQGDACQFSHDLQPASVSTEKSESELRQAKPGEPAARGEEARMPYKHGATPLPSITIRNNGTDGFVSTAPDAGAGPKAADGEGGPRLERKDGTERNGTALAERKRLREEAAALMPAGAFRSQSARLAPASVQTAFAMPRSTSDISRRKTLPLGETRVRGGALIEASDLEEGEVRDPGMITGQSGPPNSESSGRGAGQGNPPGRTPVHARLSLPAFRAESERSPGISPGVRRPPVMERLVLPGEGRLDDERSRFMQGAAMREDAMRESARREGHALGSGMLIRDERDVFIVRDERDMQSPPLEDLREVLRRRNSQGPPGESPRAQGNAHRPISERLSGGSFPGLNNRGMW